MMSQQASEESDDISRTSLARQLSAAMEGKSFSELSAVTFDHRGAALVGSVFLETLKRCGYALSDFDAVGALTSAAVPIVDSIVHAAASMGGALDAFVMDFVFPSIKGPSIDGKRVILIDSWLGEKSYIQTSSLVTLRNGNELGLDFGVIAKEGATVIAIATLIGSRRQFMGAGKVDAGDDGARKFEIETVNPATQEHAAIPFVMVYDEDSLRAGSNPCTDGDDASTPHAGRSNVERNDAAATDAQEINARDSAR